MCERVSTFHFKSQRKQTDREIKHLSIENFFLDHQYSYAQS